jgi:hypothetical protein
MIRRFRAIVAPLLVCLALVVPESRAHAQLVPPAQTQLPAMGVAVHTEPGAPFTIGKIASYTRSTTRGGVTLYSEQIYCVSFSAAERTLHSVTFEFDRIRSDHTVEEVATFGRKGTFSPGVEIRSYQGEAVGRPEYHMAADCFPFESVTEGDAPIIVVRPFAATFDDGSEWHSAIVTAVATPAPVDTAAAQPWDAKNHNGYIAVVESAGGGKPVQQHIRLFAPGHGAPSATIVVSGCCIKQIAFLPDGTLVAGSTTEGILLFAPGATTPTKRLGERAGGALATDVAGDLAIGGERQPDVAVYPANGAAPYHITAQPILDGLAFAPTGELAVADAQSGKLLTYPRGATTASRELTFVTTAKPGPMAGALGYDDAGKLAVFDAPDQAVNVYGPTETKPSFTIAVHGAPFRIATAVMSPDGTIGIVGPYGTHTFSAAGGPPRFNSAHGGSAIALAADGTVAIADPYREELVVFHPDKTTTIAPGIGTSDAIAISP